MKNLKQSFFLILITIINCCCREINLKSATQFTDSNQNSENNSQIHSPKENQNTYLDSVKKELLILSFNSSDTLKYKFHLEDIGTEGNEGIAYYLNGSLIKVQIEVYTSMWRYHIQYNINQKFIEVVETTYNISIEHSDNDKKINEINYKIDSNGKSLDPGNKERIDIFQKFKDRVPFELK